MSKQVIKAFGQVVRELRKARRLVAGKAEASALDRTFLSQLETGRKQPSLLTIFRLAIALQVPVPDLLRQVKNKITEH